MTTIENLTNISIEDIRQAMIEQQEEKGISHLNIKIKPLVEYTKKIRTNLKCAKTLNIDSNLWISKYNVGLKCLIISFRENYENEQITDENTKKIKIYKDKVYVSLHHYNKTTVGPLHYHLYHESTDNTLNELCFDMFNVVSNAFKFKGKKNHGFYEVSDD